MIFQFILNILEKAKAYFQEKFLSLSFISILIFC